MALAVFESAHVLTASSVRGLPHNSVRECWHGDPLPSPLWWVLAVDPKTLWFGGSLPGGGRRVPVARPGEYCEGLWEGDVLELFLKEPGGRYFELNISPEGAWWAMELSSYRSRVPYLRPPRISHLDAETLDGRWSALVGIERESLPFDLSADSRIHVSGIAHLDATRFISSRRVPASEPDFHHEEAFDEIRLRTASR